MDSYEAGRHQRPSGMPDAGRREWNEYCYNSCRFFAGQSAIPLHRIASHDQCGFRKMNLSPEDSERFYSRP